MNDQQEIIRQIQERNARVELEKAWERSFTRRGTIAAITYVVACLMLWSLGSPLFFAQALLPAAGYVLSTLSLPWLKKRWMEKNAR